MLIHELKKYKWVILITLMSPVIIVSIIISMPFFFVFVFLIIIPGLIFCFVYFHIFEKVKKVMGKNKINNYCEYAVVDTSFSGLKNIGSFCYMNSMIQALASSDNIIMEFKNLQNSTGTYNSKIDKFINLLNNINDPRSAIEDNTNKLSELMKEINWHKPSQQDSYELLSALINQIHKEMKTEKMPLKIKLLHMYEGMDFSNRIQDHLGLSLGLFGEYSKLPGVRLEDLIKWYFSPVLIDDDPTQKTKVLFYENAPEILLIHIQASKYNAGVMYKPEYYIIYNKDLYLDVDIAIDMNKDIRHMSQVRYQLSAIVHHMGTLSGGHYICYRNYRGSWYMANDEQVMKTEFSNNVSPYIMIYEKCDESEAAL